MLKLNYPLIVLNFKVYSEALGEKALKLAEIAEEISENSGVTVAVAPPITELRQIASKISIPVFSQHVDPYPPGSRTGAILIEAVKEAGAVGSLINHSEKRMLLADISAAINRLRENGLLSLLCADTVETTRAGAALNPDIIAVEPPELIGTGIPVSKARPEVVKGAVEAVKSLNPGIHVLCGAGISSGEDVAKAIELGAEGVLLASAYVKAREPSKILESMVSEAAEAWDKRG